MTSTDIVWADPPPDKRATRRFKYADFREALISAPGQWALYPGSPCTSSVGTNIKATWKPVGRWEVTARRADPPSQHLSNLYVRYVGTASISAVSA